VRYIQVVLAVAEEDEALLREQLDTFIEDDDTLSGQVIQGAHVSEAYDNREDALTGKHHPSWGK